MHTKRYVRHSAALCCILTFSHASANGLTSTSTSLPGEWEPFAGALKDGCNGNAYDMLKLQDGRIVVGGTFAACGDTTSNNIAIYSPATDSWESVGEGVFGEFGSVANIAEFDSVLYVSGSYTDASGATAHGVAYFNGQEWLMVGEGFASEATDLAYFDGALYASGFNMAGNQAPNVLLKRWNGVIWENVATGGAQEIVRRLISFDGALYVAGHFSSLAGITASSIARYRDGAWSAVGEQPSQGVRMLSGTAGTVTEMSAASSRMCVVGNFSLAGAISAKNVACWDGNSWSALGDGMRMQFQDPDIVSVTTNNSFYAGGGLDPVIPENVDLGVSRLISWNGSVWSNLLPISSPSLYAMVHSEETLYAGGWIQLTPGLPVNNMARLGASGWQTMGNLPGNGVATVSAAVLFKGELYIAGSFRVAGALQTRGIARWDGSSWQPVGSAGAHGLAGYGYELHATEDSLYVGGVFSAAGGVPAQNLARWDGNTWSAVGNFPEHSSVNAIHYHDGSLYVGGRFHSNETFASVLRWDGTEWSRMGGGFARVTPGGSIYGSRIQAFAVFNGDLYAAGEFNGTPGSQVPSYWNIARWDGQSWRSLSNGFGAGVNLQVTTLAGGPDGLYVGGDFSVAGSLTYYGAAGNGAISASGIVRWDGQQWHALGSGIAVSAWRGVSSIALMGDQVMVGGFFSRAGGTAVRNIAAWNGTRWRQLGAGVNSAVRALVPINDSDLYVGGAFGRAGSGVSVGIARWRRDTSVVFQDGFESN